MISYCDSEIESDSESRPLLPLEVLVKPLELRFRYHFEGDRQTNRVDKVRHFPTISISILDTAR